jgi:micrococcal nuclease
MKKYLFAFSLLCFLFVGAVCEGKEYIVRKVIDGDTIQLETGEIVRYLGIDAPEMYLKEGGREFFAGEAARQNRKLVFMKKVRLEFDVEKKDKQGRVLAYVYVKNVFINGELVKLGCAKAVAKPPNTKHKDLLFRNQQKAIEEERGIWQEGKKDTESYYVGNKRTYTLHRPSCKSVDKIPEKNKIVFRSRLDAIKIGYIPDKQCKP